MSKQSRRAGRRERVTRGRANLARVHVYRHRDWSALDPSLEPDADIGVQPGWYRSIEDRAEAQRSTHDSLIEQMGPARRGPVHWMHFDGIDEARPVLEAFVVGETDQHALDYIRQIRAHFREWGGYLVVAYARGAKPPS